MADDKRVLRLPAVMERTGLSKASIYRLIKASDFPAAIRLGCRAVGWPRRSDRRVDRLPRQHHRRCGQGPSGPTVNCSSPNGGHSQCPRRASGREARRGFVPRSRDARSSARNFVAWRNSSARLAAPGPARLTASNHAATSSGPMRSNAILPNVAGAGLEVDSHRTTPRRLPVRLRASHVLVAIHVHPALSNRRPVPAGMPWRISLWI